MEEVDVFRQVMKNRLFASGQRVLKRNVNHPVAVLHVEYDRVSSYFAPPFDNA